MLSAIIIMVGVGWYLYSTTQTTDEIVESVGNTPDAVLPDDSGSLAEEPGVVLPDNTEETVHPEVTSFEECVLAGNPIMESHPQQCQHNGETFVEDVTPESLVACTMDAKICPDGSSVGRVGPNCEFAACPDVVANLPTKEVVCSPASKQAQACTMEYAPVCGLVEVQCVTTPCPPIRETYSNGCSACAAGNVISYTPGDCEGEGIEGLFEVN